MFKKILILMLLLPVIAFSQFKIGSVSLKDSSGTLVLSSPLKTNTTDQWISRTWLPPLVVSTNSGLGWSSVTGLTLKLGTGLTIQNDTLKYNGSTVVSVDDSTIYFVNGQKLKVKYSEGLTSDIYGVKLNLSTNSGLTYDGLGKLIINSDSGVSITGNKLKVKLDATNLEFDGLGSLKIKENSITEAQISKDINLDSLKIGGLKFGIKDAGVLEFSDSLYVPKLYTNELIIDGASLVGDAIISFLIATASEQADLQLNGLSFITLNPASGPAPSTINNYFYTRMHDSLLVYDKIHVGSSGNKPSKIYQGLELRFNGFSPDYDSLAYNFDPIKSTFFRPLQLEDRLLGYKGADVASDSLIILGKGNYFVITGTKGVAKISGIGWQSGSIVTLKFDGILDLKHLGTTYDTNYEIYLGGAADFTTSANDIVTFMLDGTIWREISRTNN